MQPEHDNNKKRRSSISALTKYYIRWLFRIPYVIKDRKREQSIFAFLYYKFVDFITWRCILPFSKEKKKYIQDITNKIFNRKELTKFKYVINYIRSYDDYLRNYLVAHNGIKAWEYGLLLRSCESFKDLELLDIGPGPGTFHLFLQERERASVTCLELKNPVCDSTFEILKARSEPLGVKVQEGTMLDMPFDDEKFDFITCISTIEHLHINPDTKGYVPYSEFIEKTHRSLGEIYRILKKGGRLFLTSEAYIPELTGKEMPETYNFRDINNVFSKTLSNCGMEFIGNYDYNSQKLIDSNIYANYRGRYNTTFCCYMVKK